MIDPMGKAVALIEDAERQAQKNKDVTELLQVSTQWIAISQVSMEMQERMEENVRTERNVGFTGNGGRKTIEEN